ncbi:MAG: hypothetical protein RL095_3304 [Verrucomicrobiota bacterium]|jgi:pheromone shutdown protein TraB
MSNLTRLTRADGAEILLLGTAHVSQDSADEVKRLIEEEKPDCVAIELCDARLKNILDKEAWRKTDLVKVFREGKTMVLISNLVLASYQKNIAKKLGVKPGLEMIQACESAAAAGLTPQPIDRNVRTTLSRTWGLMSGKGKLNFLASIFGWNAMLANLLIFLVLLGAFFIPDSKPATAPASPAKTDAAALSPAAPADAAAADSGFSKKKFLIFGLLAAVAISFMPIGRRRETSSEGELSREKIEELKKQDVLQNMLAEMGRDFPDIKHRLIDERDLYMVEKLRHVQGKKILAVVGAGHVPGMIANWQSQVDLEELDRQPPPSKFGTFFKWLIPASLIAVIGLTVYRGDYDKAGEMAKSWILWTGGGAALGSLLALAHPVTILAAFVAAPITTLLPQLGVGMATGLVEAWVRKPTVGDLEALSEDSATFAGWRRNRCTRILLVFILSSIGAIIGLAIAGGKIFGS